MSKLVVYTLDDFLDDKKCKLIIENNAFIFPNGNFTLARGYDMRNATYEIELSARDINKSFRGDKNLLDNYRSYLADNPDARKFYYLRDVLIHYYGFVLFADTDSIKLQNPFDNFYSTFIAPEKRFFDKSITVEQLTTLKSLHLLNDYDIEGSGLDKMLRYHI